MDFQHMAVDQLQCDAHLILHIFHPHCRRKSKMSNQPADEKSHRHKCVLVANAIARSSAKRQIRIWMPAAFVLGQKVVGIEVIRICAPHAFVSMDLEDGQHNFSTSRNANVL